MTMKKSIALFIVLIFIAVASSLIAIVYKESQKALSFSKIYEKISQNSLLIRDFEYILKNSLKDINSSEDLDMLFVSSPLLSSKDGEFNFGFSLRPLSDKINLNFLKDKKKREYIKDYIYRVCSFYEVEDTEFFIALLEDTIDVDIEERVVGSEIVLENRRFKNGFIESFSHFYKILDYYFKMSQDSNIFKVNWKELIYFDKDLKSIIDCKRLSSQNARFLGLPVENESFDCEELKKDVKYKEILKVLNIKDYTKKEPYLIEASLYYKKDGFEENFRLRYNLFKQKVTQVEE
ncbi:hypothetical protein [Nitrosophilus labii]|uniref:hypothetical protein n=1 Tax=Nitrosophilus labii TaxID=2706014 RepID=UPI00165727F8|nr:hypothetical protein [Nitrosophilus labii]